MRWESARRSIYETLFLELVGRFQFFDRLHRMSEQSKIECLLPPDCPACGYPGCKGEPGTCPAVDSGPSTPPELSSDEVFTQADPQPSKKRAAIITVEEILRPVTVEQVLREEVKLLKEEKAALSQTITALEGRKRPCAHCLCSECNQL